MLLGLLGCGEGNSEAAKGPAGPPPIPAHVLELVPADLPRTIGAVGSLESPEMTTVASEIAGTVVELDVPEGRFVEMGHVVLRLDDTEAKAALAVTRARLRNARDRLARVEQLSQGGVASQQQLDDARSSFDEAEGAHRAAKTRLSKHVLRAPYPGRLGLRQVDFGDYVEPGDPIVQISDTAALELRFALPQRYVSEVARDQIAHGLVGRCGPSFEATVIAVDPRVDPDTRMVGLRAAVPNDDGSLHPGMAVRVRLVVGQHEGALAVPQEAIVRVGTRHMVWVLDDENHATTRAVTLGDYYIDQAHVLSGLEAGDRIVVDAHQKLRLSPHSPIVPADSPAAPVANPVARVGAFDVAGCSAS